MKINENTKVTITIGQLKRLVKESDERPSESIFTVIEFNAASGNISTVSYTNSKDAIECCMNDIREELGEEDFAECEETARKDLEMNGMYETGNVQYMVYNTNLIG